MLCYVFPLYLQLNSKISEELNIKNVVSSGCHPQTFERVSLESHPTLCFSVLGWCHENSSLFVCFPICY